MLPEDGITDEELDAIERRADAATAGPWESYVEGPQPWAAAIRSSEPATRSKWTCTSPITNGLWTGRSEQHSAYENDLDFIAAARQDAPRLVAEVRRLKKRLSES